MYFHRANISMNYYHRVVNIWNIFPVIFFAEVEFERMTVSGCLYGEHSLMNQLETGKYTIIQISRLFSFSDVMSSSSSYSEDELAAVAFLITGVMKKKEDEERIRLLEKEKRYFFL